MAPCVGVEDKLNGAFIATVTVFSVLLVLTIGGVLGCLVNNSNNLRKARLGYRRSGGFCNPAEIDDDDGGGGISSIFGAQTTTASLFPSTGSHLMPQMLVRSFDARSSSLVVANPSPTGLLPGVAFKNPLFRQQHANADDGTLLLEDPENADEFSGNL